MSTTVSFIDNDQSLTPFTFYSSFLKKVANVYLNQENNNIEFKLIEGHDLDFTRKNNFIDPICLPLILSLAQQLKNFQGAPIKLHLTNTPTTIKILEFLYRSDFFNIVGISNNPNLPVGKNIFEFNSNYLGGFHGSKIRSEHKLRSYSLSDDNLGEILSSIINETSKRDFLVEHYTYKVKDHFYDLLYEKETTHNLINEYIEILAELITNGVLHSGSDAFVLMFSDRFKTKFSISDNGIGLYESLNQKKEIQSVYTKFKLLNSLSKTFPLQIPEKIKISILSLFETLYYSMLKDRKGLFDLMCNVVINCGGYFRLHTENAQIIVSARMLEELTILNNTRKKILQKHNSRLFNLIDDNTLNISLNSLAIECERQISQLANSIFKKYSEDTRFSAIRIFEVKFRGVHIEVEIPNNIEK